MQSEIDGLKVDLSKARSTVKALQALRGRKVAVTGSLRGCGPAIVKRLLQDGASVVAADRGMSSDEAVAAGLLDADSPEAEAFTANSLVFFDMGGPGDEDGACRLAELCQESFGGMDGLVCNTAVPGTSLTALQGAHPAGANGGPLESLDPKAWAGAVTGALTEPMLAVKHALPLLRAACSSGTVGAGGGGGAVVNVAWSSSPQVKANSETLAAAGGGLVAFTHALAVSSGPHVRVNAVSVPDGTGTSTGSNGRPSGRAASGKDAASAVSFLLSNRAGLVTGQNLMVDGGLSTRRPR